jgi:hypothetical protein
MIKNDFRRDDSGAAQLWARDVNFKRGLDGVRQIVCTWLSFFDKKRTQVQRLSKG